MKYHIGIFLSAVLVFLLSQWALASAQQSSAPHCIEVTANPEQPQPAAGSGPVILISEVSFKDETEDWVEMYIGAEAIPAGYALYADSILHYFAEETERDACGYIVVRVPDGLTATTEQLTIRDATGAVIDMVCWTSSSPAASEVEDFAELRDNWNGEIGTCLNSSSIAKNASIARREPLADTDSAADWTVLAHPTLCAINEPQNAAPVALITVQSGELTANVPFSINFDGSDSYDPDGDMMAALWDFGDGATYEGLNPPSHRFDAAGMFTVNLAVTDVFGARGTASVMVNAVNEQLENDSVTNGGDEAPNDVGNEAPPNDSTPAAPADENTPASPADIAFFLINEFMPDPDGNDRGTEWVELYNESDAALNLAGWMLDDSEGGSKPFVLAHNIAAGEYLVLYSEETGIILNNSDDSVRLLGPDGGEHEIVTYGSTKSGQALAINPDGEWEWTDVPTPGAANAFSGPPPDGVTTPASRGGPAAPLTGAPYDSADGGGGDGSDAGFLNGGLSSDLEISEFLPNPEGSDGQNEWIEIINTGDTEINLGNWQLDDDEDGSKPYTLPDTLTIAPDAAIVLGRSTTKLSLNNGSDQIRLFDFTGELIHSVAYTSAPDGLSYAQILVSELGAQEDSGGQGSGGAPGIQKAKAQAFPEAQKHWEWTDEITPGAPNPHYTLLRGKIKRYIAGGEGKENMLTIETNGREQRIFIPEQVIDAAMAQIALKTDSEIEIQARNIDDDEWELRSIDKLVTSATEPEQQTTPLIPALLLFMLAIGGILLFRKDLRRIAAPLMSHARAKIVALKARVLSSPPYQALQNESRLPSDNENIDSPQDRPRQSGER